jgi:hypothetical protein
MRFVGAVSPSSQQSPGSSQPAMNGQMRRLQCRQRIEIGASVNRENIMSDNILSAVLTFSLLAGGTAAIGSEMFSARAPQTQVVALPQVTIVAHRTAALEVVTLPQVEITGHRDAATRIAFEAQASEPPRVQ